jgi:N4-gp56 family major capsid protein
MSSLITSITNAGSPQPYTLDPELQLTPQPNLLALTFALERTIPQREGTILRRMQAKNIVPNTTPIAPGTQGSQAQTLQFNAFDTPILNYAQSIYVDLFNLNTNQLPLAAEAGKRIMIALMQAEDAIAWNMLAFSTTQYKCVQGANGQDPTEVGYNDSLTLYNTLLIANCMPTFESALGELRIGSGPVQASFWSINSTALVSTLRANSQFLPTERYPEKVYVKEEVGSMGGMRFLSTNLAPIFPALSSSGSPIYVSVFGGAQAYTNVHLEGCDKTLDWVPSNYTGNNMQQVLFTGRNIFGTAITQSTWVGSFLSTTSLSPVTVAA